MRKILSLVFATLLIYTCSSHHPLVIHKVDDSLSHRLFEYKSARNCLLDSIDVAMKYNHFDSAMALLDTADRNGNDPAQVLVRKGELLYRLNQMDDAKILFERALTLSSAGSDSEHIRNINTWLGFVCFELKDYPSASNYFEQGNKNPNNQSFAKFLRQFKGRIPYQLKSTSASTTIKIVDNDPFTKVEVKINDRPSKDFIIDTGSNFLVLSSNMAKKCDIHPFATIHSGPRGKEADGFQQVPISFAIVDSIKLGDFTFYNVPASVLDSRRMSFKILGITIYKLDGAIGLPIMKEFKTIYDYRNKEITFEMPSDDNIRDSKPNMMIIQNAPFTHVGINGISGFNFLIDSGTEHSAIMKSTLELLDSAQLDLEKPRRSKRKHVGMNLKVLNDFLPQSFIVDGCAVNNCRLEVIPDWDGRNVVYQGVIAKDILRHFLVSYDFKNMRLDLIPSAN